MDSLTEQHKSLTMAFPFNYCLDCQKTTEIVIDHGAGTITCSDCGFVLQIKREDQTPNSQTMSASVKAVNKNPVGLKDQTAVSETGIRLSNGICKRMKRSEQVVELIGKISDRLGLVKPIKDRACEIHRQVELLKSCRGRSQNSVMAACVFIACNEMGMPRTLMEVSTMFDGVAKKDINRAIECIKKRQDVETPSVRPVQLVKRFCSQLGIGNEGIKAVEEAIQKTEELDIRRSPKALLAAIIYIITQLSPHKVPIAEIANVAEVSPITMKKSFTDILPHASRIIPDWYASKQDIKKIPIL